MDPSVQPDVAHGLALAILTSSAAPALLLDGELTVIAGSTSFYSAFGLDPPDVSGQSVFALGAGEWNVPQLRSLLDATLSGHVRIEAYEMDLKGGLPPRRLVLSAQKLDYGEPELVRLLLTISDVTEARLSEKLKDDLLREKAILLQELQHRVANSLQIIASVLMQSARRVQSDEARGHLHDAHNRVMSIATLQQQLAASRLGEVELREYLTQLCKSLGASMIHDRDKVSIAVTADGTSVNADISVSLGLIVTELVINALKHAFPGGVMAGSLSIITCTMSAGPCRSATTALARPRRWPMRSQAWVPASSKRWPVSCMRPLRPRADTRGRPFQLHIRNLRPHKRPSRRRLRSHNMRITYGKPALFDDKVTSPDWR